VVDPKVNEYQSRIVKTVGDGILAEFASVVDALHGGSRPGQFGCRRP